MSATVCVYLGEALGQYHFGSMHPFGPLRYPAFVTEFQRRKLEQRVAILQPLLCEESDLLGFHTAAYVDMVKTMSQTGNGYLDGGDTPAFTGMYDVSRYVVGSTVDAVRRIMCGEFQHAFVPIAGLHHASRQGAAGFCIFNDCGVAIEMLKNEFELGSIAYIDIDAHHGDGVFYGFEEDPGVCIVDFHEDGRYLYPGSGHSSETGIGKAAGTKLNIPMAMYANDEAFLQLWDRAEQFIAAAKPEFIFLQCGADSLKGDPITHLHYTTRIHAHVARRLSALATQLGHGRLLAMGGGGYNTDNLSQAWCDVVAAMLA